MNTNEKQIGNNRVNLETNVRIVNLPVAKRPRGRPRGSHNRVSKDARAFLAEHSLPSLRLLCKLAAGASVKVRGPDGSTRVLTPNLDQVLAAARIVIDRVAPGLRATELHSTIHSPLDELNTGQLVALLDRVDEAIAGAEQNTKLG